MRQFRIPRIEVLDFATKSLTPKGRNLFPKAVTSLKVARFFPFGVDVLVAIMTGSDKRLTYPLADQQKSLCWLNTHSNCLRDPVEVECVADSHRNSLSGHITEETYRECLVRRVVERRVRSCDGTR